MTTIPYRLLTATAKQPTRATDGSAGFDLYADLECAAYVIAPGERQLVPSNVAMAIPPGYVGLVCPRSGLSLKKGITVHNGPGVIDSDYRGGLGAILHNTSDEDFVVEQGDRIAQLVITVAPYFRLVPSEDLDASARGLGGFGSSGV